MKAGNLGRIGHGINRKFDSGGAINSDLAGLKGCGAEKRGQACSEGIAVVPAHEIVPVPAIL
ncbi:MULTISPECIES: hypothetical protein [Bosea]|jgi:hypothetical protein|uniref:hypothetical protein n=1 Tax=Bosea TaxID=85413 RepID=UPI0021502818|nr:MULTISPECIES: hypothetical protein [Bosea]MCR4520339.1 hypothetical protein [Bosea sp. 47.2.35]MDR6828638.1 hypothetical protein [Bosea robiniae]MDR6895297.1 hypothetical protein [Bosea sp. BE109]MDR7138693.1 hypothetical protein [Bosea sp. BE168]MDR7175332.1 hypothetical protein [Bosea sp. BE271]